MFNILHLELTSRCNKACFCCGRRKMEREHPELCDRPRPLRWRHANMVDVVRSGALAPRLPER